MDDGLLGAACVRHQGVGANEWIEATNGFENAGDGLGEKQDIACGGGFFESGAAVDCRTRGGGIDAARGADAEDGPGESGLTQRQSERAADESDPDDGNGFQRLLASTKEFEPPMNTDKRRFILIRVYR